jgi:glycosyltransferase involved in cell wall biosynthesis
MARWLYSSFGRVLTHSTEQSDLARTIAPRAKVAWSRLPLPDLTFGRRGSASTVSFASSREQARNRPVTVLFFGLVRPYKGLAVLLRAAARVSNIRVLIAGEFWEPIEKYRDLISELELEDRVELRTAYVPMSDVPELFAEADVLALPYLSGTSTVNVALAFLFGLPVIASDAGTMQLDIRDGVDGYVVPRGNVALLTSALERISDSDVVKQLKSNIEPSHYEEQWLRYVSALTDLACAAPASNA